MVLLLGVAEVSFGSFASGTRPAAALAMTAMLPEAEVK
jgi:hypothetical protein